MTRITLTARVPLDRADKYIAQNCPELSRSRISRLFERGAVLVNKKAQKPSVKLAEGDLIEIEVPDAAPISARAENIALDIVYEDGALLVVNKPRGMVVHPAAGNAGSTLVNAVLFHCGDSLSGINGALRPGIVHRIDKDTTGLLAVAKTDAAHLSLSAQLKDKTLFRRYLALVHGNIKEDSGLVDAPLGRSANDRKKYAVTARNSKNAQTEFTVMERFGGRYTLVRCDLKTGRTHQIRVHMKHIGHPVVGDRIYGVKKEEFRLAGQLLHAREIGFVHPVSGREMRFEAPLPEDFSRALEILRARR